MKDPHFNGRLTKNVNIAGKDVKIYLSPKEYEKRT